jgi:hypothetical protein
MSKIKNEQELRELFETQFDHATQLSFEEWLDEKLELGEIEICEFNHYDCGNLDYKPVAKLIGSNGNIFNLMGIAKRVLIREGREKEGREMCNRIVSTAKSYDEALVIIMEYVEVE